MITFVRCDSGENLQALSSDICWINPLKWKVTLLAIITFLVSGTFLLRKWKNKSENSLLLFHNWRAAVSLVLGLLNSFELARSFLWPTAEHLANTTVVPENTRLVYIIIGASSLWNSLFATGYTLVLMWYHRVVELKKKPGFLYLSGAFSLAVCVLRFYEYCDLVDEENVFELEPMLQFSSATCLALLCMIDVYTAYKNKCKEDLFDEYQKIGYRHNMATFYSKCCFWWLMPILSIGYKEPLELDDLGEVRSEDSARAHYDQFLLIYSAAKAKNGDKPPSLWFCYVKSTWRRFLMGGLFKLFGDVLTLISPLAIQQIVLYIETMYSMYGSRVATPTKDRHNNSAALFEEIEEVIYHPTWDIFWSNGWVIAWIMLVAAVAQGTLSQASTHVMNMTGINIKTSLQGLIYRKTLLLSSNNRNMADSDDGLASENQSQNEKGFREVGAITNLMSEDTLNVMSFFWICHYVWAIPLKIVLIMYLLYLKLGVSAIIGSSVCILTMTPLQFLIGKAMSSNSERMAKCSDSRLKSIHDAILGIRLIKLNAWEGCFIRRIQSFRRKELLHLNRDSFYWTLMTILTHISSVLITFVTLSVFVCMEELPEQNNSASGGAPATAFTASKIFSALALFQQLTVTLLIFPITVPIIISAVTSTKRLEEFLGEREIQKKFEGIRHMARILSKSDASLDIYETGGRHSKEFSSGRDSLTGSTDAASTITSTTARESGFVFKINDAPLAQSEPQTPVTPDAPSSLSAADIFAQPHCSTKEHKLTTQRKDLLRNKPYVGPRPTLHKLAVSSENTLTRRAEARDSLHRDSLLLKISSDLAVSVKGGSFAWDPVRRDKVLRINDLDLPREKLTIIVGKNGSGKSSLLHGLMLEMPLITGDVIWNKTSTIAYVAQEPWLLNDTIRENILFGESFRPQRYDVVLEACALKPDLEIMPAGDLTIIGERGLNLSGGQRQRIAIARALYSSANVVIMDDPFSSLDNEVARHVFSKSINEMLLATKRTVILTTQQMNFVQQADYLIFMNNGCIEANGYYNDLEVEYGDLLSTLKMFISEQDDAVATNSHGFGRTARERWRLFKNVARLGMQRSISQTTSTSETDSINTEILKDGLLINDEDQIDLLSSYTPSLVGLTRKRSSIYDSRHLLYDVPLPIDECQTEDVVMRRRRGRTSSLKRNGSRLFGSGRFSSASNDSTATEDLKRDATSLRVKSWQPKNLAPHKQVTRNVSSPGRLPHDETVPQQDTVDGAVVADLVRSSLQPNDGYRQFLRRMSNRRANKPSARLQDQLNTPQSILSITEEMSVANEQQQAELPKDANTPDSITVEMVEENVAEGKNLEEIHISTLNDEDPYKSSNKDFERKYGKIPTKIYMIYLRASRIPIVVIFFISALVWQILRVLTDVWLQQWTHEADSIADEVSQNYEVMDNFQVYMIMSICCVVMAIISVPAGQLAGMFARANLHDKFLESIMHNSLHFFQIVPVGRLLNRFGTDMAIIDKKIAATSQRLLQFMLLCLCAVAINISITTWFVLLAFPIFCIYYSIQKFYRASSRELQRIENLTSSPILTHLSETVQGVTTIRTYNQEARFTEMLFKRLESNAIAFTILNTSHRWLGISLDYLGAFIVFVAVMTALFAATYSAKQHAGSIPSRDISPSPSLIGLAINYTLLVPIYLNWVVKLLADIEMYIGSVERIAFYMKPAVATEVDEEAAKLVEGHSSMNVRDAVKASKQLKKYKPVPISWPQRGEIVFDNVTLRYEGQQEDVIKGLTLKIPAGQKIGICGRTGSGKSSLALSLFGFLQIRQGCIRLDDYDITDVHPDELRSRLSIIPQEVHLFNGTVRENIDPTGYFSDLQIKNSLELAQLNDFVYHQLPKNLDTQITNGGHNMSAGERQLFSLARAILRGSVCLVMDEATSSLDATTEASLLAAAHKAFTGRTILTIAHRLSTILEYDRVVVLDNGTIVEDGNPRDLQRKRDSIFRSMLDSARPISAVINAKQID